MAEKTDELKRETGIMSETDKEIVSAVAAASDDDFTERYSDEEPSDAADTSADDPQQIRSQIEKTRRDMSETIDEIQERLSYSNISEQVSERVGEAIDSAKTTVYEATVGKAENFMKNVGREMRHMGREISKTEAGKTVVSNPVPFALIGLGAGILLLNAYGKNKSSRSGNGREYGRDHDSFAAKTAPSALKSVEKKIGGAYESVSETASDAYENVSGLAGRAYEGVTQAAGSAYGSVSDAAHQAYEKAGEFGHEARRQYDHYIEEKPLVVGALAFAVGAAVGFAIPSTRYESRLMGEARDQFMEKANRQVKGLMNRAETSAHEQIEKVKTIADETARTAREESKNQGLVH